MVLLVPHELREASLALGVPRWRTTISVVARTAMGGIATGVILATARIAGETAPLLFTAFGNHFWSTSLQRSDLLAAGADLYLCDFAVRRLAAPGVGRSAGPDRDCARVGVGSESGDRRPDQGAALTWQTRS